MRNLIYFLVVVLISLDLISCRLKRSETVNCYSKDYGTLLEKLNADFENQLEINYLKGSYEKNLYHYLQQLINKQRSVLITPSSHLRDILNNSEIQDDIWLNNSINLQGNFFNCLKLSDNILIKDYIDRLVLVGDISPKVFAAVVTNFIDSKQQIDQDLKLVIMVNYYLIG